jgi:hypothetical protein
MFLVFWRIVKPSSNFGQVSDGSLLTGQCMILFVLKLMLCSTGNCQLAYMKQLKDPKHSGFCLKVGVINCLIVQTSMGDIEIGFFPTLAPITAAHILKLFKLGCYNSNHFFRVRTKFKIQVHSSVF